MELEDDVSITKQAKQACLFGMTLDIKRGERWMLLKWANGLTTFHSPKPQSKLKSQQQQQKASKQTNNKAKK